METDDKLDIKKFEKKKKRKASLEKRKEEKK